jgi:hypothetical protein
MSIEQIEARGDETPGAYFQVREESNRRATKRCDGNHWAKRGQATKGTWWMPWRQEPKKGAVSCEKLRGAASRLRSGDARMGKPTAANLQYPVLNT